MERAMTVEERIRKAEDIYNRRNGIAYSRSKPKEKKEKLKKGTVKKLFMQIFVCLSIYIVFYAVTNREHIFSEEFRNEVNSFFTQKTNISQMYLNAKSYIQNKINGTQENTNEEQDTTAEGGEAEEQKDTSENTTQEVQETKENKEENIGGATEETQQGEAKEENKEEEKKELSEEEQMKKDAEDIKSRISFIKPIEGRISSTFGWRNPTTSTVPKYHTGLDIAANEGTVIKSATDGKVIMASSQGDYGNHYQIQIDDIVIVYAHCKKLYLKEGDTVKQGQEIAEVGSTGNSTGPHLHFEIRKGSEKIDPQLILDF